MEIGDWIKIECEKTGLIAEIEFKTKGYFSGTFHAIEGLIKRANEPQERNPLYRIFGKWTDKLYLQRPNV